MNWICDICGAIYTEYPHLEDHVGENHPEDYVRWVQNAEEWVAAP